MRHHVGSHTDGDTAGAVHEQLRDAGRKYGWFLEGVVEVELEVDGVLVDVFQHIFGHAIETGFYIPHRCRAVTVLAAEVTLAVHEHVAHGPVLGHTVHGVENGGVTV